MSLNLNAPATLPDDPYQRLKHEYDRLRLLYDISQQLASTFNLPHVLQQVLVTTSATTGAARGSIILFKPNGEVQQHLLTHRFHQAPASAFTNRVVREGLASWVLQYNRSALIHDTNLDERWLDYPSDTLDVRSALCVPLVRGRRVRGALTLVHPDAGFFNKDDEDLLNIIAHHAALAIENAQLIAGINDERRKFEGAVTAMEEGLLLVDGHGQVRFVNPQVMAFFAITPPVPVTLREFSLDLLACFEVAQRKGENIRTELTLAGPPRLDLAVQVSYMPVLSEDEDWWAIMLHDISLLKDYDRLKTQFVANASHELRTPLANIKLYARLAAQGKAKSRPAYLQTITSEASRLETIVEDLLTLSRLDSGLMHSEPAFVQLDALLSELTSTYRPLAETKSLQLVLSIPVMPLPPVWVAPDQCVRVVVNLLSNAIKFTPVGGIITVAIGPQTVDDQPGLAISVADTGPGIPPQESSRLFERFYRASNISAGGSGLGLAIVRELLALMGGSISVDSVLGQGSVFTCWIPLPSSA